MMQNASPLVTTAWLADHLKDPDLVVVDGSYHLPAENRDAGAEYLAGHIPGAVFFDIDEVCDKSNALPHMMPDAETFAAAAGKLGISNTNKIVVYDVKGLFSAGRVWWTFKMMGAEQVAVLDGGLKKWLAEGRPVESGPVTRTPAQFAANKNSAMVSDADTVLALALDKAKPVQIVDARSAPRFFGEVEEPRQGLRSGRIPGSYNVPLGDLLNEDGTLKHPDEIAAAFRKAGVDLDKPVITSCGSGVTACGLALGLEVVGQSNVSIYDGSWTEWGARDDLPVKTGR